MHALYPAYMLFIPHICFLSHIYANYIARVHRQFEGLCAQHFNEALDFAISHNLWPVTFTSPDNKKRELVTEFTVGTWSKYISRMVSELVDLISFTFVYNADLLYVIRHIIHYIL